MLLEEVMKKKIHTLSPSNTLQDALSLFKEHRIRHVPIVENEKVVGVLSDRDLKEAVPIAAPTEETANRTIDEVMTKNPITGHPLDFVEETALTFYEHQIGCLPVVSNGKLVGFLTETDLLYKYIELTGAHQPGSQLEVRVPNRSGSLYEVSKVFYEHHANVLSVLVYPDKQNDANKILAIRVQTMNPLNIIEDLRKEGFDVLWPNTPEIQE